MSTGEFWGRRGVLPVVLLAATLLRLPAVFLAHGEPDEEIYLALARSVWDRGLGQGYTLRGSPVLADLPAEMYDKPIFHHPPGYVLLLAPFVRVAGTAGAAAGNVACGVALIALLHSFARRRYGAERAGIAAAVAAACPVLGFVAGRVWMDGPLALATVLGLWAWQWALAGRSPARYALAGLAAAAALLIKLPAVLAAPVYLLMGFEALRDGNRRERWIGAAVFIAAATAAALPWFLWFRAETGRFLPDYLRPTPALLEAYPFMAEVTSRAPYYFLVILPVCAPLYVLAFRGMVDAWRRDRDALPAVWALGLLATATWLSWSGFGFQMRFLTPALPGFALATAAVGDAWTRARRIQFGAFAAFGLATFAANAWFVPGIDDVFSLPQLLMGWLEGNL